jgi:hypothetical protein
VADFDGDGEPEVGVAGLGAYTMFDSDGTVVWSNTTQDRSSSRTGSSVFDFEGDGVSEVVYADEEHLYIYSGPDGAVLLKLSDHASGTLYEYPLIADVDQDGSAEIVVASNDYAWAGWQGITVIGDRGSTWAPARPVWNQFAYSITNVEADGGIPLVQQPNWRSWNNFRAAGSEAGPPTWKADLGLGEPALCLDECSTGDHALLWLPVQNSGLVDAGAFAVTLVVDADATETEVVREEVTSLAAGASMVLGPFDIAGNDWRAGRLTARVDPDDAVEECEHEANTRVVGTWPCP